VAEKDVPRDHAAAFEGKAKKANWFFSLPLRDGGGASSVSATALLVLPDKPLPAAARAQ
jgi:hypothetical protein